MEIFDFIVANEISKVEELLEHEADPNMENASVFSFSEKLFKLICSILIKCLVT